MATEEKSRDAFEPKKRYAAVGMQLGRVLVDDDFNEAERIRLEEERRVNIDVIGPVGSPDAGFQVVNGSGGAGGIDFEIAAGTLYLGGLRLWNPAAVKYSLQADWLQQTASDRPPLVAGRTDLVYIEAWQQPVTAVEDSELFEVALGGPDTSDRLRTMWRVHVVTGVDGDDCPDAWAEVVSDWAALGLGTIDASAERVVDTELQVTYTGAVPGDLCTPAISAGYLGAENQTIRVQLREGSTLIWGFDNAAPVYRATISSADQRTITLLTDPRDEAHWPTAGQVVEILPWSAVLSNNEKLAEETGHLARIETSYTSTSGTFVLALADAVPAGFGEAWETRSDAVDLGLGSNEYVFVRVWNRGDDPSTALAIPYVAGTPVDLGTTGLRVTITGTSFVPGDHWVIAARPKTPDQVVPWELESGRRVHGTRRFFAPLGLIEWNADGTFELLHDCRPYFPPLTRIKGCCTYTVGDDVSSFGQYKKIQDAVNALPPDGGKVCVLPGKYEEIVFLDNKQNVTIEGCGPRSRIVAPAESPWCVIVVGGHDITIKDLAIECADAIGILFLAATKGGTQPTALADAAWGNVGRGLARIRLEGLTIKARGRSAIVAVGGFDYIIRGCEILAGPLENVISAGSDLGKWPAILMFSNDVLIEDNRILARNEATTLPGAVNNSGQVTYARTALGGIQIGGGSRRWQIRRNLIEGGNGDGVTLGSWAWVPDPDAPPAEQADDWNWWDNFTISINDEGCIEIDWDPDPQDPDGQDWVAVSMGDVHDIAIIDNRIQRMGRSGVGVARFFDLRERDEIIAVRRLLLRDNRIEHCIRLPIPALPDHLVAFAAQGAITLAEVEALDMQGNEVRDNGRSHTDPVCGLFALVSSGVIVENNRIVDNAPFEESKEPVRPGWRGGVVLTQALPPSTQFPAPAIGKGPLRRQSGEPSARISDNTIVVPEGRAIAIIGYGPMSIADNHLTTRGPATADFGKANTGGLLPGTTAALLDILGGVAVAVFNGGRSNEFGYAQLVAYNNLSGIDLEPTPGIDPRPPVAASGNILFEGNQVNVDLLREPDSLILSAIALLGLDEVLASVNQLEVDRFSDRLLASVIGLGISVRAQGNRVKESLFDLASIQGFSIYTIGILMNMITGNQTTRCVIGIGNQNLLVPNQVLLETFQDNFCNQSKLTAAGVQKVKFESVAQPEMVNMAADERMMYRTFDLGDEMTRTVSADSVVFHRAMTGNSKHEVRRAQAFYGEKTVEVADSQARVALHEAALRTAKLEATKARIEPVKAAEDSAVVHGVVLDKTGTPRGGVTVRAIDAGGKPLAKTTADDRGYFRLDLAAGKDEKDREKDQKQATTQGRVPIVGAPDRTPDRAPGLRLEVADGEKVLYRDRQPLRYKVQKHRYREIRLD